MGDPANHNMGGKSPQASGEGGFVSALLFVMPTVVTVVTVTFSEMEPIHKEKVSAVSAAQQKLHSEAVSAADVVQLAVRGQTAAPGSAPSQCHETSHSRLLLSHRVSHATGKRDLLIIPVTQHAGKNGIRRIKPRVNIPNHLLSGSCMMNEQN